MRFMRGCNRSQPHVELLKHALGTLGSICRYQELQPAVYAAEDCISMLTELLQMFRDKEVRGALLLYSHANVYVQYVPCGQAASC